MKQIVAVPASDGLAVGTVRRLRHVQPGLGRAVMNPQQEAEAFQAAAATAREQLEALEKKASGGEREIFTAQRMMLEDEGLINEILAYIRAGAGAAPAVERAAGIFAGRIRALDDDYLRERACDVLDACYRVVDVLDGRPRQALKLASPAIVAADELYPTDILTLNRQLVLGLLTAAGSASSHASILARTMGIPAVVMAGMEFLESCDGCVAALDGTHGEVFLEPDEATKARFSHSILQAKRRSLTRERLRELPCATRDGTRIALYANCTTAEDVQAAVAAGAQGVGRLQSEYMLMAGAGTGEEEQYHFYVSCLEAAKGRPVTICTYDIGADKAPVDLAPAAGPNPALGLCGVRYSFAHPSLFETQLRALLRAGVAGNLRIVLPMVAGREDLERALDALYAAKTALRARRVPFAENVPVGVMIETPSAALEASELAQKAAFFEVSVMNLTQYTHAVDREDPAVQAYFPENSPAVHRLLRMTLDAAAEAHIPVCVCCEGAASPFTAETYVRLGAREISLPAGALDAVKEYLMGVSL